MMDRRSYMLSEDYLYEIKHNESFFTPSKSVTNIKPMWSLRGHDSAIEGVHIINSNCFVTVSHDCLISFWDFNKKNLSNIKLSHPILSSSFNKRQKLMIVGLTNKDTNICLIDLERSKISEKVNSKIDSVFCLNYFDDYSITCGSKSGSIILLDLSKKKNIYRYEEIDDCISCCSFNSNHSIHFFGTYRGTLSLFDFRKLLPIYKNKYFHSQHSINSVFSFNNCVFTAGSDCLIKKFDVRLFDENKPLSIYMGHTSPIHFLSFSPNYSFFCSSSDNGSIRLWKNNENIDALQNICSRFSEEKKKINKSLLSVNAEKEKKKNIRSSSIASERGFLKSFFLPKNENLKKNYKEVEINKRTLTPNLPRTHERKLSSMSKQQIFTSTRTNEVRGSYLFDRKNDYGKKSTKPVVNIKNTLEVSFRARLRPSASVNPPAKRNDMKLKESSDAGNKRAVIKINDEKLKITPEMKTSSRNIANKINNNSSKEKGSIKNNINIVLPQDELPFAFETETNYANLSMLHHRNKVSSMDWLQQTVVSVSWDQTIKCWDLRNYIQ